ncbi:MAG: ATP-dependent DNA ligase [Aquimonas sp.]|nr:ATP-dependent DNA ligase [Aquimonas sp.]
MQAFAALYRDLESSSSTRRKRELLEAYFRSERPADAAWALHFLLGRKLGRIASSGELRAWVAEASGLEAWLVEDSYAHVGDLAETLAMLLPEPTQAAAERGLAEWVEQHLLPLRGSEAETRRAALLQAWQQLPEAQRLVFNKLLTGALRIGVSAGLVQQALARIAEVEPSRIAQRLLGDWQPRPELLNHVLAPEEADSGVVAIQPFQLASPLEDAADSLGPIEDWLLEWKWDGIRMQLLREDAGVVLWSRGEERMDGRFPEIEAAALALPPGTLLDGELLAWRDDAPLPFVQLQKRINRLKPGAKLLAEVPLRFLAYDALFAAGEDLRARPLQQRRSHLQRLLSEASQPALDVSDTLTAESWPAAEALRADARRRGVEGLMLKRRDALWQAGRRRGAWWKWKLDPLSVDAVLIYAQAGHGRRATLYTDYTFALWEGERLLPVAKAYSGLDDAEILRLDRWIRAHTIERFGPVRSVLPELVFEIGFEGVNLSSRHKSGVALRFPRILRWREDKLVAEADRVEDLRRLAVGFGDVS